MTPWPSKPCCARKASSLRASPSTPTRCSSTSNPWWEPLLHDQFTPTREWLRGAAATLQDPRRPQFLIGLKLNLPPEYLLIHRVWLGGIGVLSQIGGTVPLRELVCAHLSGIDESRLPPSPS